MAPTRKMTKQYIGDGSAHSSDVEPSPPSVDMSNQGLFGGWGHEVLTVVMTCVFAVCILAMPDLSAWAQKPDEAAGDWNALGIMVLGLLSVMLAARSVVLILITEIRRLLRMNLSVVHSFKTLPSPSFLIASILTISLFLVVAPLMSIISLHPTIARVLTIWGTTVTLYYHHALLQVKPLYLKYLKEIHPILLVNVFKPSKAMALRFVHFWITSAKRYLRAIQEQIVDPKFRKAVTMAIRNLFVSLHARFRTLLPLRVQAFFVRVFGSVLMVGFKTLMLLLSLLGTVAKQIPSAHQIGKAAQHHWWKAHGILPNKPLALLLIDLLWAGWEPLKEMAVFTATGSFLESEHFKLIERQYSIVYLILAAFFSLLVTRSFLPHLVFTSSEKQANRIFLFTVVAAVAAVVVFTSYTMGDLLVLFCHFVFRSSAYKIAVSGLATKPTPGFERDVAMNMRAAPPAAFRYLGLLACLMLLVFGLLRVFRSRVISRLVTPSMSGFGGYSRGRSSREKAALTRKSSSHRGKGRETAPEKNEGNSTGGVSGTGKGSTRRHGDVHQNDEAKIMREGLRPLTSISEDADTPERAFAKDAEHVGEPNISEQKHRRSTAADASARKASALDRRDESENERRNSNFFSVANTAAQISSCGYRNGSPKQRSSIGSTSPKGTKKSGAVLVRHIVGGSSSQFTS